MISAISNYMPRWLMALVATALVLATVVGSNQDSAEAIDPADTDTVYIADGTNFADALMGATIASLNTSPMLGVAGTNSGDVIPGDTVEELDRLTNNKASPLDTIYIFGGTSAVSADVENQLGDWANDVQRIEGDSRWGTYEAISQMLPSAIDEAVHAQEADNADTLDGNDSNDFLGATDKAADSELLDGMDSTDFALSDQACASGDVVTGVAADGTVTCAADEVDGGNADTLDGLDSTDYRTLTARSATFPIEPVGSTCEELHSVEITVPTSGIVEARAEHTFHADHTNGTPSGAQTYMTDMPATCSNETVGGGSNAHFFYVSANDPSGDSYHQGTTSRFFEVAAGTHTFYFNGDTSAISAGANTAELQSAVLTAIFYPGESLPSLSSSRTGTSPSGAEGATN